MSNSTTAFHLLCVRNRAVFLDGSFKRPSACDKLNYDIQNFYFIVDDVCRLIGMVFEMYNKVTSVE